MAFKEFSVLEELKAVFHFIKTLRDLGKPAVMKDAHILLSSAPEVKKYLRSMYKLDDLYSFFVKYPGYFKITSGTAYLIDPEIENEEIESVIFFHKLFSKRENRPLHATNAQCFISAKPLEEFLNSKYNLSDLTPFFARHKDIFNLNSGLIELKYYVEKPRKPTLQESLVTQSNSNIGVLHGTIPLAATDQNTNSNRSQKKLEKKAVQFFLDLIWKRKEAIVTTIAHSFLGDNVEIREYLKSRYNLSDLQPFFQAHSEEFEIKEKLVFAKVAPPYTKVDPKPTLKSLLHKVDPKPTLKSLPYKADPTPPYLTPPYLPPTLLPPSLLPRSLLPHALRSLPKKVTPTPTPRSLPIKSATKEYGEPLTKSEKKKCKLLEKQAVEFFLNLIWKRKEPIATTQAHSYLGVNVEIREYLRAKHSLNDLKPFFEAHPAAFEIKGIFVFTRFDSPSSDNVSSTPSTSTLSPQNSVTTPPQRVLGVTEPLSANTSNFPNYSNYSKDINPDVIDRRKSKLKNSLASLAGVKEKPSASSDENKNFFSEILLLNRPAKTTAPNISNSPVSTIPQAGTSNQASLVDKTRLPTHLWSLVMATDPTSPNLSNSSVSISSPSNTVCTQSRVRDASCQTISSGPILSLNVIHEVGKST